MIIVVSTPEGLGGFLGRKNEVGCIAVVGRVGFVCGLDVVSVTIAVGRKQSRRLHVWV